MKTPAIARLGAVLLGAFLTVNAISTPASADIDDCPSGYMCIWSGTGYPNGPSYKTNATGSYKTFSTKVGSFYNNRSKRTYLHEKADGSGTYVCLAAGSHSSSVSGWKNTAKAVYLSTVTAC